MHILSIYPMIKEARINNREKTVSLISVAGKTASQIAQWVKNLPAMQEMQVWSQAGRSPGGGTATHSSILAWRIPGQKRLAGHSQ